MTNQIQGIYKHISDYDALALTTTESPRSDAALMAVDTLFVSSNEEVHDHVIIFGSDMQQYRDLYLVRKEEKEIAFLSSGLDPPLRVVA